MATSTRTAEERAKIKEAVLGLQPLSDLEFRLLMELRKHPFAEITVEMKAGQPHRIIKGVESVML